MDNKPVEVQSVSTLKAPTLTKQGIMNDFASIQIGIASPEKIREWSYGEVKKAETINYRTQKPERDGLFCERIFGPIKDWECHCGKYKRIRYKGIICEKCGVQVTKRKVRRERMGHIELAAPVSHIWYFRGVPSRMGLMLDISPKALEQLINFQDYIVLTREQICLPSKLKVGKTLTAAEYKEFSEILTDKSFRAETSRACLGEILRKYDVEKVTDESTVGKLFAQLLQAQGEQSALISSVAALLGLTEQEVLSILHGECHIVSECAENVPLTPKQILTADEYAALKKQYSEKGAFRAEIGADGLTNFIMNADKNNGVAAEKSVAELLCGELVEQQKLGNNELTAKIAEILEMSEKDVADIADGKLYVVMETISKVPLQYKQQLSVMDYRAFQDLYSEDKNAFRAGTGAESIREMLCNVDLEAEATKLKNELKKKQGQQRVRLIKRLDIIESFRRSGNRPEWMVLTVLPVLPPDLRPMVPLDGGRYATSDLNDLYRRVINRNNRLKKMIEMNAPESLINNEKRMLQDAVDSLIDNSRSKRPQSGAGNRELKSLTGMLKGKQGRFRQNLLGKRVDYSGRSVIVVGPELKLHQCGIPKEMALELFKPFVMKKLVETNQCHNVKSAKKRVERADAKVWDILEDAIKDHPVMLNRAPTLHRLSIQAFEPVLIDGRAIKLHPLACPAFNADFDGDQMSVHVPLSLEAQAEARYLMLAANNILKLSDGKPVIYPTQDMVLGCYYLTMVRDVTNADGSEMPKEEKIYQYHRYASFDEAYLAYIAKDITLQTMILVRRPLPEDAEAREQLLAEWNAIENPVERTLKKFVLTTVGRMIFVNVLPPYAQDGSSAVDILSEEGGVRLGIPVELNFDMIASRKHLCGTKKELSNIVERCFKKYDTTTTANMLDNIKALGYKYSTISGLTASVFDMHVPAEKYVALKRAESNVVNVENEYEDGLLTDNERYKEVVNIWSDAFANVQKAVKDQFHDYNPIKMMTDSGARGSISQLVQLCGMRGLMSDTTGKTIELPVKSCFREGLSVLEYFISSHGGRKGLADTALKTADSGYLTRRLVDVSHNVIITEDDCCKGSQPQGMWVTAFMGSGKDEVIEKFEDRIVGKYYIGAYKVKHDDGSVETVDLRGNEDKNIYNPQTGELVCPFDQMITDDVVDGLTKMNVVALLMRTVLTCKSVRGVCSKCYGKNMATGKPVHKGEAVGVIAAQSIGEPGTQLTMRTFHTGGVASADDITQGLPRVEELFEARRPKGCAVLCENSGIVSSKRSGEKRFIVVTDENGKAKEYQISYTSRIKVNDGDKISSGDPITEGPVYPQDLLKTKGLNAVEEYLLKEVQATYRGANRVEIDDKHVEIIIRQMLKKVRVEDAGDTELLPGELVDISEFDAANQKALQNDGVPATAKRSLLGITKAALATDSFLSASSFQETPRVLTEAAIKAKRDYLLGLKENVIIGKLISAGTGLKEYRDTELVPVVKEKEDEAEHTDDEQ